MMQAIIEANRDDEAKLLEGTELLLKLTHNISKNPTESKFRTIRSSIPKIQKTLFSLGAVVSYLLQALGFLKVDDEHYVFVGDYFKVLRKGQLVIEQAMAPIRIKHLSPEERVKWNQIEGAKRIHAEQQREKKEIMENMKRMQANDRKEKAQDGPAKASIANKLSFGANVV